MAETWWELAATGDERFPYRLRIVQGTRLVLSLRVQDRWPGSGRQIFCLRETPESESEVLGLVERVPVVVLQRVGRKLSVVLDRPRQKRCEFLFLVKAYKNRPDEFYEQIFFRTQESIRGHRSRGRLMLFRGSEITVAVDSNERYPWRFPGAEVKRMSLPAGDYALLLDDEPVAVVERKTFENLRADLADVRILHQRMSELAAFPHAAVVVEAQYADYLQPERVRPMAVTRIAAALAELAALYPRVPLVWAGTRKHANQWAHGLFAAVAARLEQDRPARVAEEAPSYGVAAAPGALDRRLRHAMLHELPGRFTIGDVRMRFPEADDGRIRRVLRALRDEGRLRREGRGPGSCWVRTDGDE